MSGCEKYQVLISALIDGELSESEKSELAEHLKSCRECSALYEAFSGISESIHDDMEDVPEVLHENIMAEIRRTDIKKKNKKLSKPLKTLIASAACAALIIGAAVIAFPEDKPSAAVYKAGSAAEIAKSAEIQAAPAEANLLSPDEAPAPEVKAAEEPASAPEADEELILHNGLMQSAPIPETGAKFSFAASYELEGEKWEAFLALISGEILDSGAVELPEASFTVSLKDSSPSAFITVYLADGTLIYFDSCDSFLHSGSCSYNELQKFLNIL